MLKSGQPLEAITTRFPTLPHVGKSPVIDSGKNGVIAKGSTQQLDAAEVPSTDVAVAGMEHAPLLQSLQANALA